MTPTTFSCNGVMQCRSSCREQLSAFGSSVSGSCSARCCSDGCAHRLFLELFLVSIDSACAVCRRSAMTFEGQGKRVELPDSSALNARIKSPLGESSCHDHQLSDRPMIRIA